MRTITQKVALAVTVTALTVAFSIPAQAQGFRGRGGFGGRGGFHGSVFYDPFWSWGPYYPYGYPYGYYPVGHPTTDVRVQVVPKQTEVFVDGYYAGTADDFDGVFKHLHTTPGGHAITLYLDGYKTVTQNIYARPFSTYKMHDTMDKLAAGEVSSPPPAPAPRTAAPATPTATN